MADQAAAPEAPKAKGGSFFQRKMAGLPVWAWAAIIGGGVAAWWLYQKYQAGQASSTTSTASSGTTGTASAPGENYPTGGFGVGGYGGTGGGTQSSSQSLTTSLPFQVLYGSGWGQPPSDPGVTSLYQPPITDANGNTYEWISPPELAGIQAAGETIYYEPLPGVFLPAPPEGTLNPETPAYIQVPQGTPANPAAPTTSTAASIVPSTGSTSGASTAATVAA